MNHNLIREFLQKMEGHIYIPVLVRLAIKAVPVRGCAC